MPRPRPRGFDSGDFCQARPIARGEIAGGAGAVEPFERAAGARLRAFAEPEGRYRLERAGRDAVGNRPPLNRAENHGVEKTVGASEKTTCHAPKIADGRSSENLCHRRLYQRGQIQPVQPSDQGGRVGERPAFCHAGYDGAAFVPVA